MMDIGEVGRTDSSTTVAQVCNISYYAAGMVAF